jgi:hypothetical protein
MFFGQFLTERPFSLVLAIVGVAAWVALWIFMHVLAQDERR